MQTNDYAEVMRQERERKLHDANDALEARLRDAEVILKEIAAKTHHKEYCTHEGCRLPKAAVAFLASGGTGKVER